MKSQRYRRPIAKSGLRTMKRQAGVTLMETMIALALSLVVTTAMVILMANSLGTATRVIHMSQLTDELRNAMSMMTRDVRRANYSANSIFCFGYSKCGFAGGNALQAGDIQLFNGGTQIFEGIGDCFTYTLDRGFNGDATDDAVGAFRRVAPGGVGVVEMWAGGAGTTPKCETGPGEDENWVELTDPSTVNITAFEVNLDGSVEREIAESKTSTFDSRQREIQLTLRGQLIIEEARGNTMVRREVGDIIYVRNDYVMPTI